MTEFLDAAERLALLKHLNPNAFTALDMVLTAHEEQPDMPLSATARRLLEARRPDGLRAALEGFVRYAEAAEQAQQGGAS